jgi:hypothetical protein
MKRPAATINGTGGRRLNAISGTPSNDVVRVSALANCEKTRAVVGKTSGLLLNLRSVMRFM